jgi:hypothetical protein
MPKDILIRELVQFVGLKDLAPEEQDLVQGLTTKAYEKLKRDLQNTASVVVHIKRYKKASGPGEEKRQKFSVHVKVIAPTKKPLVSSMAHDWELPRAVHKAFNDIQAQLKHAFYTDATRPKPYD